MAGKLNSMTGFGSARGEAEWGRWSVEAKSVNGKSLDVRVNTPPGFDTLEPHAKAQAAKAFNRGNLQVAVRVEPAEDAGGVHINTDLLQKLIKAAETHNAEGFGSMNAEAIATLMTVRGVVETASLDTRALAAEEVVIEALRIGIAQALDMLMEARRSEGDAQEQLFKRLIAEFRAALEEAQAAAEAQPAILKSRLEAQLSQLDAASQVDTDRLAAEVALSVAKADVREETDRLDAHLGQAEALINAGSPVGRKLEFLSQEIGREANTLCSKSASLELTNAGLALKALNDQFKEQAANVE